MVVTKVFDPVHLIGYQLILSRVAEEFGGARTAYYYDLLLRQKLAKQLENGAASVNNFLMHLDRDILGDAKAKVGSSAKRWPGGHLAKEAMVCNLVHQQRRVQGKHKKPGDGSPRTVRGHQISGASVVPGHARRDGPEKKKKRRQTEEDDWSSKNSKSGDTWSSRRW